MTTFKLSACAAALALTVAALPAFAAPGDAGHGHGAGHAKPDAHGAHGAHGGHGHSMNLAVGQKGERSDARRALRVAMTDNAYAPRSITVQRGETVRFIVKNTGEFVHEFNIGTAEAHQAHQAEMLAMMESGALTADRIVHGKMGDMTHDDPNSILLEPGQSGEVVWKFVEAGEIEFACNVPGHYESGMRGRLKIR